MASDVINGHPVRSGTGELDIAQCGKGTDIAVQEQAVADHGFILLRLLNDLPLIRVQRYLKTQRAQRIQFFFTCLQGSGYKGLHFMLSTMELTAA